MGFTWIHLNQVNVGTNVAIGCASYRQWCALTGVSTCATVNTCTIMLGSFYCTPNSPASIWKDLTRSISEIQLCFPNDEIILGGNFNCPGIDWSLGNFIDSYICKNFHESLYPIY